VGGQAGAEMTDFLVVLNSRSVGHIPLNPAYDADQIGALGAWLDSPSGCCECRLASWVM
jgi:hypothetical protein